MSVGLKKTVVLVGMMGAGKTAVGRALAARLGVGFLDSDAEIEAAAHMSIKEIFDRDGEAFFRMREREVIDRLLGGDACILSTGGGAFLAAENRALISSKGVSVCLNADLELLWSRVAHKDTRPLLQTENPKQTLSDLFDQRAPLYAMADVVVDCDPQASITEMAEKVEAALIAAGGILEVSA